MTDATYHSEGLSKARAANDIYRVLIGQAAYGMLLYLGHKENIYLMFTVNRGII